MDVLDVFCHTPACNARFQKTVVQPEVILPQHVAAVQDSSDSSFLAVRSAMSTRKSTETVVAARRAAAPGKSSHL